MKYSIGDRVIVKESGEKGIVVKGMEGIYRVYVFNHRQTEDYWDRDIKTDLTAIEKPFGLLSKEVQEELKAVNNGENMQMFYEEKWNRVYVLSIDWQASTYRLDPNWKAEEVKERQPNWYKLSDEKWHHIVFTGDTWYFDGKRIDLKK